QIDVRPTALALGQTGVSGWGASRTSRAMETRSKCAGLLTRDAALDWSGKSRSARPARWTSLFGADLWRANETKKARSVVALSRVPRGERGAPVSPPAADRMSKEVSPLP